MKSWITPLLILGLVAGSAWGYDVYKYSQPEANRVPVPDADKPNVAGGMPAPPADQSCWQAAAANILAGAGWGKAGNTPQQNAAAIYQQMKQHFGTAQPGNAGLAANWWLYNYGYNANAPDPAYYRPELTYNDVTRISYSYPGIVPGGGINGPNPYGTYDWLLDELDRCQYVTVLWELANSACHWLTLVGGDYSVNGMFNGQSVWHDSDRDWSPPPNPPPPVPTSDDNAYVNGVNANNGWALPMYQTVWAQEAIVLCPGLQKRADAVGNYDYAYYWDQDAQTGEMFITSRTSGAKAQQYGDPTWIVGQDSWVLEVPNEQIPDWQKVVQLLIDYTDRDNDVDPGITLMLPDGTSVMPAVQYSNDFGQILLTWELDIQPAWERIVFPDAKYLQLNGDVKDWNLATVCVPEPATAMLVLVVGVGLLRRR